MPNTDSARISLAADGTLVAFVIRQHRQRLDEGLNNPATGGYVEQDLLIARSRDRGRTWIGPDAFTAPLVGPCFEICAPITMLSNDAWLLSTSTWQDWDGYCPNGIRTLAFISHDHGASWPTYVNTMTNLEDEITYWESKMIQLHDGRVLVVAWAYDRRNKRDLPNQYVISSDGGETFSQPASTGLLGQTLTPLQLGDGRLLSAYRRMDRPGLWAVISHLEGDHWVNEDQHGLWGTASGGLVATTGNMVNNFARLQFGAPCLVDLGNGMVHVSFWAAEECLTSARWIKVKVT